MDIPEDVVLKNANMRITISQLEKFRQISTDEVNSLAKDFIKNKGVFQTGGIGGNSIFPIIDMALPFIFQHLEEFFSLHGNDPDLDVIKRVAPVVGSVHNEWSKQILLRMFPFFDSQDLDYISEPLIRYGSDDLLPHLPDLFEREGMGTMSAAKARAGAMKAGSDGHAEPRFIDWVWEHCLELLRLPEPPQMYDPLRVMKALDEKRFADALHGAELMNRDHPLLPLLIARANATKVPFPADFLCEVIENSSPKGEEKIPAIMGLIQRADPRAGKHGDWIIKNSRKFSEEAVISAWEGRLKLAGMNNTAELARQQYHIKDVSFDQLDPTHQKLALIEHLQFAVRQACLDYFFGDPLGHFAGETIAALKEVGAKKHSALFEKLVKIYGVGPIGDSDAAFDYVTQFGDKTSDKIEKIFNQMLSLPSLELLVLKWDWNRQR